jgi:hypothetical protein
MESLQRLDNSAGRFANIILMVQSRLRSLGQRVLGSSERGSRDEAGMITDVIVDAQPEAAATNR